MRKSEESSGSDRSLQKFLRKRDARVLREYYSGVPAETLHRRYGMSLKRIKELSEQYRSGKIDIFDERDKYAIEMEEEGIDLLKKAGAGLSASSSRATEK